MPFGNKAGNCRVYEYGCLEPLEGEKELIETLFERNLLWNKLVETDRKIETKFNELTNERALKTGIDIEKLVREVEYLYDFKEAFGDEVKALRKKSRSGKSLDPEMKKRFARVKKCYNERKTELKEIRHKVWEENKAELNLLDEERKEAVKSAKHSVSLWWHNADDVVNAYEQARKKILADRVKGLPRQLRFHPFDGTGKVMVRLRENGTTGPWRMPVENVFRPNNIFWIEPVSEAGWLSPVRSERRRLSRTTVHFCLDSGKKGGASAWLSMPVVMHRPLPENGVIRAAAIIREKIGRHFRYKLVVTVEMPERKPVKHNSSTISIDIGWRLVPDGLRVAKWKDSKGRVGSLILLKSTPPDGAEEVAGGTYRLVRSDGEEVLCVANILTNFEKIENLRSIRDRHFDDAKNVLVAWLEGKTVPDWLREAAKELDRWRDAKKMAKLLSLWHANRFSGDQEIVVYLEEWLKRDKHLHDWEANLRDKVLRRRQEFYRIFASRVAKNYGTVVLEDFDIGNVARKPEPMEGTAGSSPMDRQRVIAATSELRLAIENACSREGVATNRKDPAYTTKRCHVCGHVEEFGAAKELFHQCSHCGAFWDQDENAADNLLA